MMLKYYSLTFQLLGYQTRELNDSAIYFDPEKFDKKFTRFLEILEKLVPIKIEGELKRESRGFTMIIVKA